MSTTLLWLVVGMLWAQPSTGPSTQVAWPGRGLAEHPFLYAGEWDTRKPVQTCYIIRDGKVAWSYEIPSKRGEISDATVLANGDVLIAHQHGALVVSAGKKVLWSYDCPDGTEVHTIQPAGDGKVLIFRNGNPAVVMQYDIRSGAVEHSFEVSVGAPTKTHGQVRHMRITPAGTLLIAHMDSKQINEYALPEGHLIRSIPMPGGVWSAVRLRNGNTLASTDKTHIVELDPAGQVVWQLVPADIAPIPIHNIQEVCRLDNGNTAFTNWIPNSAKAPGWPGTVQVVEVTPEKKVAWALSQWVGPDLGPATCLQLLDQSGSPEAHTQQR